MPEERAELEKLVRRRQTAQDLALRARIVLRCAEGATRQQTFQVAVAMDRDAEHVALDRPLKRSTMPLVLGV